MATTEPNPVDILLVDDNPGKLLALEVALAPLGQTIVPASSGEEALRLLMKRRFATIILDVNMPGLDGFQTAQMIRSRASSARTPIIFVSAVNLEAGDALRGYSLGAVDYIVAPVVPEVLRAKVSVFVELYRATEELERLNSEARTTLAAIVESSQDAIVSKTTAGIITSWNAGAARIYGYTAEEAIGRPITIIIPPELHDQEREILSRIKRGERIEHFETERLTKDGRRLDISVAISPLRDAQGRIVGASKVARDISERKASERALRDSERRFRTLSDASPGLIFWDDPDGNCIYVNQRYLEFFGATFEQVSGRGWHPMLHAEDAPAYIAEFQACQAERRPFHARVRALRHDGSWRWLECHAAPLYSDAGAYLGHVGVCPDVTEGVEAEQALRDSEQRYRQTVQALPAAVYTCNLEGRITLYNKAAEEVWGRQPDLANDRWCGSWKLLEVDGTPIPHDQCLMARAVREARPFRGSEVLIERPDGTRRHVLPHPEPIYDGLGRVVGGINMLLDVTELKHTEAQLARARDELAGQLADVTRLHEVSTRLTGTIELQPALEEVLDAAIAIQRADFGNIQLVDRATGRLRIAAQRGFQQEFLDHFSRDGEEPGACGLALLARGQITVEDTHTDERLAPHRAVLDRAGVRAVHCTPLVGRRGVLGVLSTHFRVPYRPGDADARLLDIFARQIAEFIDRRLDEEALRESESRFRALADNIPQLAWMADGQGATFWYNRRWFEYTGLTPEESRGWGWTRVLHPDQVRAVTEKVTRCFATGEPLDETFLTRGRDGTYRWFLCRAFPIRDEQSGAIVRWFGTSTDVTDQREAQQILARDRATLERLVAERTEALELSNERLRVSERFASIGTLAAGLGHDMGNLLLPVRFHLESIRSRDPSPEVQQDVAAVLRCTEYLQKLAHGLRMLALDNEDERASSPRTEVESWWANVAPVLRGCLPRGTVLDEDVSAPGVRVMIAEHQLSQAVFNIVQNAGDALRGRTDGVVRVRARSDAGVLRLEISDNGPGMPEDIRRRCFEPFFTTKARAMSTGLGLSLVRTLITRAGGTVHAESVPGNGTTFVITAPAEAAPAEPAPERRAAAVTHGDPRIAGYIAAVLKSYGFQPRLKDEPDGAEIWVVEGRRADSEAIARFCGASPERRVVVVGAGGGGGVQVAETGDDASPVTIREAVREAVQGVQGAHDDTSDPAHVRGRQRADRRGDPAQAGARG